MNAPKFTPGPWEWRMEVQDRGIGKGNSRYAALGAPRDGHPRLRQGVAVPNWCEADGGVWQAWITVAPANANLIAAAPELYAALDGLRTVMACHDSTPEEFIALANAVAALNKAQQVTA